MQLQLRSNPDRDIWLTDTRQAGGESVCSRAAQPHLHVCVNAELQSKNGPYRLTDGVSSVGVVVAMLPSGGT